MLSTTLAQRPVSVCAFCQTRLTLSRRPVSISASTFASHYKSRPFSSSSRLYDNEKPPPGPPRRFAVGAGGAGAGDWGQPSPLRPNRSAFPDTASPSRPIAPARPAEDFAGARERAARASLLASTAPKPKPPAPNASQTRSTNQPFARMWNPQQQKDIQQGLKRIGMDAKGPIRGLSPLYPRKGPDGPNHKVPPAVKDSSKSANTPGSMFRKITAADNSRYPTSGRVESPRSFEPKNAAQPSIKKTYAPGNPQDPIPGPTSSPPALPSRQPQKPAPPPSKPQTAAPTDNEWGLLSRKPVAAKTSKDDFWASIDSGRSKQVAGQNGTNKAASDDTGSDDFDAAFKAAAAAEKPTSRSTEVSDWGRSYDNEIQFRNTPQKVTGKPLPQAEDAPARVADLPEEPSRRGDDFVIDRKGKGRDAGRGRGRDRDTASGKKSRGMEVEDEDDTGRGARKSRRPRQEDKKRGMGSRYDNSDYGRDDMEEYSYESERGAYDRARTKRRDKQERNRQRKLERSEENLSIRLPEFISISDLAKALQIESTEFLSQLGELGFDNIHLDSIMAGETAGLVAQEYGYDPTVETGSRDILPRPPPEDPSSLPPRPPVVTIMGHVDHGKTTLLDYLRKSSVVAQEHGGITQHIGAFSVNMSTGKQITFLDTPGHAAFLSMRQRGASVTDIVVLVVASDDSVKPQTREAIKHAQAAKVPVIVAISKIDKDGANVQHVKSDLASAGVEIEDYGGDVQVVCVSGKTGQGMEDLEESIVTLSEIMDMRAEADGGVEGWVLESSLKADGKTASVLVKRGTLRPGDFIAAGEAWAKVRHLRNEAGVEIDEAPPGTPVEVFGWKDLPAAGDQVLQADDEGQVKDAVEYRISVREQEKDASDLEAVAEARRAHEEKREMERQRLLQVDPSLGVGKWNHKKMLAMKKAKLEAGLIAAAEGDGGEHSSEDAQAGPKVVNFFVKGDVHGSVEAVSTAVQEIGSHEVVTKVLRSATGPITESEVDQAATSDAIIINFNTTTPGHVAAQAESAGVRIIDHNIIYRLVDDVKGILSSHLAPDVSARVVGDAEVSLIFPINVKGRTYKNIAGCKVRNGLVSKTNKYRVLRGGKTIHEGELETLKHHKKDVTEMRKGTECGMGFEDFQDFQIGDTLQAYEEVFTPRTI